MHNTCQLLPHFLGRSNFHRGYFIRIRQSQKDGKYRSLCFFNIISNDNLNDTHCQMFGTTKNKNIIAALEPSGILIWRMFTLIKVRQSHNNLIFKLVPCFNMTINGTAMGISRYKDKTVVIYSHVYNSYTARRRLQINTLPHLPHPPPTFTHANHPYSWRSYNTFL